MPESFWAPRIYLSYYFCRVFMTGTATSLERMVEGISIQWFYGAENELVD
jgi:hypothetical protein